MPVTIKKNKGGGYQVRTPNMIHAKNTTKAKAVRQERLLNALEHNPGFRRKLQKRILK